MLRKNLQIRVYWRHYFIREVFNSALPSLLSGVAAETFSASLLSILNATSPVWGAIIGALWTRTAFSKRSLAILALGVSGVTLLVSYDSATLLSDTGWAVAAALGAA